MGLCASSSRSVEKKNAAVDLLQAGQYAVVVDVARARNVKKMDLRSESDTYVVLDCGGTQKRTVTFSDSAAPVWNSSFRFQHRARPDKLRLVAKDEDVLWDDTIGHHTIELGKYWDREPGQAAWEWVPVTKTRRDGTVELNGEIEVRITAYCMNGELAERLQHYGYTHLLEITVLEARNLRPGSDDAGGPPQAQIEVAWGAKAFRSFIVRGHNPRWKQKVHFWANSSTQQHYTVHVSAIDAEGEAKRAALGPRAAKKAEKKKQKNKNKNGAQADGDRLGGTFVAVSDFFSRENQASEGWYALGDETISSDRTLRLAANLSAESKTDNADDDGVSYIKLRFKMIPKEEVLATFFDKVLADFDASGDGILQRAEARAMFDTLGVAIDDETFEQFWVAVDADGTGEVTADEAHKLLRTLLFVNAESANRVMAFVSDGAVSLQRSMMQPARLNARDRQREIPVMDRVSGLVVREFVPNYIVTALAAMYDSGTGRALTRLSRTRRILARLSERQGVKYDDPESVEDIVPFVELHRLNMDEVLRPIEDFQHFNDFFYRELKPSARPVYSPHEDRAAVSPADCRMMVFADVHSSFKAWIKGQNFTLEALFGERADDLAPRYRDGSLCVARLAPQDYHRYHYAVGGRVVRRTPIDGALYTVNPIAVNSELAVFSENKRVVEEIETEHFGLVTAVCIGATMVGSISFLAEVGDVVAKGQQHGYFAFGGSTVLWLFEKGAIQFDADIVANSSRAEPVETLVRVNTRIGLQADLAREEAAGADARDEATALSNSAA